MNTAARLPLSSVNISDWSEKILPLRRQADVTNEWLRRRLQKILPQVMRRAGIDMWIVASREYNEDPVLMSLLPAPMMSARRRTVLVFHAPEEGPFEAMAIANAGIYDFALHHEQILVPVVLRHWDVENVTGLDAEGEQAREKLMKYLNRSAKVAARINRKREAAAAGEPELERASV